MATGISQYTFEINCFAQTQSAVDAIASRVIALLDGFTSPVTYNTPRDVSMCRLDSEAQAGQNRGHLYLLCQITPLCRVRNINFMPLTSLNLNTNLNWLLSTTNAYGTTTMEGPDSITFNPGSLNVSTWNQLYANTYTIAASANQTINLSSLTNLVGETFGFGHVLGNGD